MAFTLFTNMAIYFCTNIWIGIVGDIAVDLYLLRDMLTADRYVNLLQSVLPRLLENVSVAV
jgi:hypothetical protein